MLLAKERQKLLTKPEGSLGTLEELSIRIAGIVGEELPVIDNKLVVTMAGDHGVTGEGVSNYPKDVTAQMVHNFLSGGAAVNVLARHVGARVIVVDMGVAADIDHPNLIDKKIAYGTDNIMKGPAMSYRDAEKSISAGAKILEDVKYDVDIIGVGDMGIGNTTPSSAVVATITEKEVWEVTGRGTGIDDERLRNKIRVIERAIKINKPDKEDPKGVLAKVGGFEIGGMAGLMLAAASHGIPIVIDGFISGAAALIAYELESAVRKYLVASHRSSEKGHSVVLDYIGLDPLLDMRMRLGEGTGATLAMSIVDASCKILSEMATFKDAGVSERI